MKAITYYQSLPTGRSKALVDLILSEPTPGPRNLLVEVRAVFVDLMDMKACLGMPPVDGRPRMLGWDAADVVHTVDVEVPLFRLGNMVWYAGAL